MLKLTHSWGSPTARGSFPDQTPLLANAPVKFAGFHAPFKLGLAETMTMTAVSSSLPIAVLSRTGRKRLAACFCPAGLRPYGLSSDTQQKEYSDRD
jgi:hypothetical protein